VENSDILEALELSAQAAELVLLKVEQLQLLVTADKPRRLIELAHAELEAAIERADQVWESHGEGFAQAAASAESAEVKRAWQEFRALLGDAARSAAQASAVIASQLAVAEDALSALGFYREYGSQGESRLARVQSQAPVMA
jgi:hypothetical protein